MDIQSGKESISSFRKRKRERRALTSIVDHDWGWRDETERSGSSCTHHEPAILVVVRWDHLVLPSGPIQLISVRGKRTTLSPDLSSRPNQSCGWVHSPRCHSVVAWHNSCPCEETLRPVLPFTASQLKERTTSVIHRLKYRYKCLNNMSSLIEWALFLYSSTNFNLYSSRTIVLHCMQNILQISFI